MYTIDTCPHCYCGDCAYFKGNAHMAGVESTCKRIDHKTVKFAVPWFKSYDCGQRDHIPCGDFVPAHPEYADFKEWTNFSDFWQIYVKAWLPYENEDITVPFTIYGDTSVRYHVPLVKYIDGTMIVDGVLQATEKEYYKRIKDNSFPFKLIHETIDGVLLNL